MTQLMFDSMKAKTTTRIRSNDDNSKHTITETRRTRKETTSAEAILGSPIPVTTERTADIGVASVGVSRKRISSEDEESTGSNAKTDAGRQNCLGWLTAMVEAIGQKASREEALQYLGYLELGHVRRTCALTVDRWYPCYRCHGYDHRARVCPASASKCPLYEVLGTHTAHRMEWPIYVPPPPRLKNKRLYRYHN